MDVACGETNRSRGIDILDVGVGILLFFASHMVIRVMYYVGFDRTPAELSVFLVVVVVFVVAAHVAAKPLLRLRSMSESGLDIPIVSAVAVVGAVLALVSMLPVAYHAIFYAAAAFLGLSCGWISVIWASSTSARQLDAAAFRVDSSLAMAVVFYFLFRAVSTFSEEAARGFLLALPLVAIACMLQAFKKADGVDRLSGRMQALMVPAIVSAAFALAGGIATDVSGHGGVVLESGMNYMVFFEVLAVVLMLSCCEFMKRFSRFCQEGKSWAHIISFAIVYVLMFVMGAAMGGMGIPSESPSALWESNLWVMLIAVFAYDIRDSLYAVEGLAIGLMFEAMCVGQMVIKIVTLGNVSAPLAVGVALSVLYFASAAFGFFRPAASERGASAIDERTAATAPSSCREKDGSLDSGVYVQNGDADADMASSEKPFVRELLSAEEKSADDDAGLEGADAVDATSLCEKIARKHGLTDREAEILELVAAGRSAKYIADELFISYNTARTHIKHVYEKLNIHSKQELIDLVRLGL